MGLTWVCLFTGQYGAPPQGMPGYMPGGMPPYGQGPPMVPPYQGAPPRPPMGMRPPVMSQGGRFWSPQPTNQSSPVCNRFGDSSIFSSSAVYLVAKLPVMVNVNYTCACERTKKLGEERKKKKKKLNNAWDICISETANKGNESIFFSSTPDGILLLQNHTVCVCGFFPLLCSI